ncbi:MAG: Fic family protein [Verrucomicrobiae bacterium]|nr:Fic family protein [Verrucomicrobiae bacterium]NNJ86304.1 Fic family protein [Akkermansiaceae bacterium]
MRPPFSITPKTLHLVSQIERLIGRVEGLAQPKPKPHLCKSNRVKTVHGSLAIEGNTLGLDQITALLNGKRVLGKKEEIREVLNANDVYDQILTYNELDPKDLLKAHGKMMCSLMDDAGKWRAANVGILKGSKVSHMAPKADRVPLLMEDLFGFLKQDETHPLIRGCVFHYELEFIHPFQDGNGRIGRFWHSLLLTRYHPVFEFIPVESLIREHQKAYYQALETSDQSGNSTAFVEFSLSMIHQALEDFVAIFKPEPLTAKTRLETAKSHCTDQPFSRKQYLDFFKTISTATASRDLKLGTDQKILSKTGEKAVTVYRYL